MGEKKEQRDLDPKDKTTPVKTMFSCIVEICKYFIC